MARILVLYVALFTVRYLTIPPVAAYRDRMRRMFFRTPVCESGKAITLDAQTLSFQRINRLSICCQARWSHMAPIAAEPLQGVAATTLKPAHESGYEANTGDMADVTDADVAEVMKFINDVKQGKHGHIWQKEMLSAEDLYHRRHDGLHSLPGMADNGKPNVAELLNERNQVIDEHLNHTFDISDLHHPTEEEINSNLDVIQDVGGRNLVEDDSATSLQDWEDERYFHNVIQGNTGMPDLKKMLNGFYRDEGLLNEPVVRTLVAPFRLHWHQTTRGFDVWFPCLSHNDGEDDYAIAFLPQELTITYKGKSVSCTLRGKVDVDGCFWSLHELPSGGKVVSLVLPKRAPLYAGTWEHLLRGTHDSQPPA